MPLKRCTKNGKKGWKFGDKGKCYTSKKDAIKQGIAIYGPKKFAEIMKKDSFGEVRDIVFSIFDDIKEKIVEYGAEDFSQKIKEETFNDTRNVILSVFYYHDFDKEISNNVSEEDKLNLYILAQDKDKNK